MPCGPIPPMPRFGGQQQDPTVKELAALCVGGSLVAGVSLVERLSQKGVNASIDTLVLLAAPTGRITAPAFDLLADALAASRSLAERLP